MISRFLSLFLTVLDAESNENPTMSLLCCRTVMGVCGMDVLLQREGEVNHISNISSLAKYQASSIIGLTMGVSQTALCPAAKTKTKTKKTKKKKHDIRFAIDCMWKIR